MTMFPTIPGTGPRLFHLQAWQGGDSRTSLNYRSVTLETKLGFGVSFCWSPRVTGVI